MREQQPGLGFQASNDRQDQGPSSAGAEEKQTSEVIIPNRAGFDFGYRLRRQRQSFCSRGTA
jgi:hypothetical protein